MLQGWPERRLCRGARDSWQSAEEGVEERDAPRREPEASAPEAMLQRKAAPCEGWVQLLGVVARRVEDVGAERPRVGLAQRLVDGRRQLPRLRWQVDREDVVHPALERVEDGGVRTVGAALREGGSDPRDGAGIARLRVDAELPLLLEKEVLDVGAMP